MNKEEPKAILLKKIKAMFVERPIAQYCLIFLLLKSQVPLTCIKTINIVTS